ncbi:MAG TPA: hypothetical protein VF857_02550 [Spirochaetota bacterium]
MKREHQKRIMLCAISLFAGFFLIMCAGEPTKISSHQAEDEFSRMERRINEGKGYPKAKDELFLSRGFFYVLSPEGLLLIHPNSLFIGGDFSNVRSVREIITHDRGNVTAEEGGIRRKIFYARLRDGNYLCLSINSEDFIPDQPSDNGK